MRHNPNRYADLLTDILPILWRRLAIYVALVLTSAAAFLFYRTVGERHESYALLRVEQGIKDRSTGGILGEAPDLTGRIESLGRDCKHRPRHPFGCLGGWLQPSVGGIALGSAFALMLEFRQVRREDGAGHAIEEIVRRSVRNRLRAIEAAE